MATLVDYVLVHSGSKFCMFMRFASHDSFRSRGIVMGSINMAMPSNRTGSKVTVFAKLSYTHVSRNALFQSKATILVLTWLQATFIVCVLVKSRCARTFTRKRKKERKWHILRRCVFRKLKFTVYIWDEEFIPVTTQMTLDRCASSDSTVTIENLLHCPEANKHRFSPILYSVRPHSSGLQLYKDIRIVFPPFSPDVCNDGLGSRHLVTQTVGPHISTVAERSTCTASKAPHSLQQDLPQGKHPPVSFSSFPKTQPSTSKGAAQSEL